jgi:hypothetical protein
MKLEIRRTERGYDLRQGVIGEVEFEFEKVEDFINFGLGLRNEKIWKSKTSYFKAHDFRYTNEKRFYNRIAQVYQKHALK